MYLCYRKEAELLSRALGAKLIKTSVKEDINVNAVFWYLAAQCIAELRQEEEEEYTISGNGLHPLTISKRRVFFRVFRWEIPYQLECWFILNELCIFSRCIWTVSHTS